MSKIVKNIDDVKLLLKKYEWLKDKVLNIVDDIVDYDGNIDEEEVNIELSGDNLEISFTTDQYCYGEHSHNYYTTVFPISWLFLDDEELEKAEKEKEEAEEEAKRKLEEKNEMLRKRNKSEKTVKNMSD